MAFDRVAVVGLGLIGGSLALELRRRKLARTVVGVARRARTLQEARRLRAIDTGTLDLAEGICGADLVVFCTPVAETARLLADRALFRNFKGLVTDVASVKRPVVRAALSNPACRARFVGSHPMAGSEHSGIAAAQAGLFDGCTCLLTPAPRQSARLVKQVARFWSALGMRVFTLSPPLHDQLVAATSHFPHLASNLYLLLMAPLLSHAPARAGGPSFREATRVGGTAVALWMEIFRANARPLTALLRRHERLSGQALGMLERADWAGLERLLKRAAAVKDKLFAKPMRKA